MVRKLAIISSFLFSLLLLSACQETNHEDLQKGITAYFNGEFEEAEIILAKEDDELAKQWLELTKVTKDAVATTIDEETEINPFQSVKKVDISFMGEREKELFEERLTLAEKEAEQRMKRAKKFATLDEETKKELMNNKEELSHLSVHELVQLFSTENDTDIESDTVQTNEKNEQPKNTQSSTKETKLSSETLAQNVREETKDLVITITDIITDLLKTDAPFDSQKDKLLQYVTPELYASLKKHYDNGDFCYQCDVPHIPGQYNEITFKKVDRVDEHDAYIIYTDYGLNSEGFEGEIPMEYHYKKLDGRWKLHKFRDL